MVHLPLAPRLYIVVLILPTSQTEDQLRHAHQHYGLCDARTCVRGSGGADRCLDGQHPSWGAKSPGGNMLRMAGRFAVLIH